MRGRVHTNASPAVDSPRGDTFQRVLVALVALLVAYLFMAAYIWKARAARARARADRLRPSAE